MRRTKMAELDPVKYEIFYQRMEKILNEAKEVVRYLSGGMITREAGEVQEAFYLPNGEAALIAAGITMHIMNVTRVIRYMNVNKYHSHDIGIYEGDQFINNDAYLGGMHCQDTSVIAPLFYKNRHVGFTAAVSHTTDVGAIESAGTCPSAREAIHDGLHLNAVKLVERGVMRRDVFGMILRAVRDSTYVELDIRARMAGNERAIRGLRELIDDVGIEFFEEASRKLVDDAEAFARDRIKTLRPGIYRSRAFDDCPVLRKGELEEQLAIVQIETEVTEDGDYLVRVPVVSPENRGFNNAYLPAIEATVFYTLLTLLLYDCRWNSGFARAIKIDYVPDKSRLSASPERSVNYASIGIGNVFCCALMDALSKALYVSGRYGDVAAGAAGVNSTGAGGINQYGRTVVQSITSPGTPGGGAVLDHDGSDSSVTMFNPWTYLSDVESEELAVPIIHLALSHRPDSGGFGKFRGGTGVRNVTMIHNSPSIGITKYGTGNKIPLNQGMFGGYPGSASFYDLITETNIYEAITEGSPIPYNIEEVPRLLGIKGEHYTGQTSSTEKILKSGDIWGCSSHGGGAGLGDPIERDPALIVKDIENKVATLEVAQKVYAVVIDPKRLVVDHKETERLRGERRKERLAQGIPGIRYLEQLVKKRENKEVPRFILDFLSETEEFCPAFVRELAREKQIARMSFKPLGEVKVHMRLMRLTPYVDIVEDENERKVAVCSQCGFGYCEAHDNFKLYCLVYDRACSYFHSGRLAYDKEWCVFREFYCPSCAAQIEVEAVPQGMPILWNYELKI
jgi:N-methylhydantoinase B/oxoprolinase/acetone carboxylase alpha subunit